MKDLKEFENIEPNSNLNFNVLYNYTMRTLKRLERQLIKDGNGKANPLTLYHISNVHRKLKQMVAKWKFDNKE